MDATKLRLFAAGIGIICGIAAVFALSAAGAIALSSVMGWAAAVFTIALILVAITMLMIYLFLQPYRTSSEEIEDLEETTANALADLPFDTLKSIAQKYPLTTSAGAMLLGYTLIRDPQSASRHAQRLIMGLL